ncbi:MAG: phosphatidate cytidylyltransferase [Sedimentisphaerales bacterium]|nr:phosphatidate cytidylyltransferase [Sedimentisphaerales bacterium]
MLKHRLIFGTLMTVLFAAVVLLDGWLDGSISKSVDDRPVQASLLCCLFAVLIVPGQFELSGMAKAKGLTIFKFPSIVFSIAVATTLYWPRLFDASIEAYLALVGVATMSGIFLRHYLAYRTNNVITNCGANFLSIFYLGFFACFALSLRIEYGVWPFLMFIAVVKLADIGAYTAGSLWGKHKFSPKISPGKTWEGMAGAVIFAIVSSVLFAVVFAIMSWQAAVVFGVAFAFIGQLGDLLESMLKRDARQKDSSSAVPGFGGVLDVIDSPLFASPFAYLFFTMICR